MKHAILTMLAVCVLASCTDSKNEEMEFRKLMMQEGITNPVKKGAAFIGCSGSDDVFFSYRFSGLKNGVPVNGIVCGALFKGRTIRYE